VNFDASGPSNIPKQF
jgi:hypothetical protein